MSKNKSKSVPPSRSLDDLVKFFDTHDTGEYWKDMPEAHFEVSIKDRRHLVAIDDEISGKLTEIAQAKKISSQKLVNSWLREKIRKAG
jgi:hypothetical protein